VGLESLVEAGEQLCHPDVSQELIPPEQRRVGRPLDLAEGCLLVLSGSTSRLAEVVKQSARAGTWGLTNVWRYVGAVPLTAL